MRKKELLNKALEVKMNIGLSTYHFKFGNLNDITITELLNKFHENKTSIKDKNTIIKRIINLIK